jgi:hypothetical protein
MEVAAFKSPLSEQEHADLGRLAVSFSYAETLLNLLIVQLLGLPHTAQPDLIAPLATRRKLEILGPHVKRLSIGRLRDNIEAGIQLLSAQADTRNIFIHGLWTWAHDEQAQPIGAGVINTKKATAKPRAATMAEAADQVAIATRHLHLATYELMGGDPDAVAHPVSWHSGDMPPPEWQPLSQ